MSVSERAVAARNAAQRRGRPKLHYVARAKVGTGWITIGACWPMRSGEDGYSLKLTTIPMNWDGRFILLPSFLEAQVPVPGERHKNVGTDQKKEREQIRRHGRERHDGTALGGRNRAVVDRSRHAPLLRRRWDRGAMIARQDDSAKDAVRSGDIITMLSTGVHWRGSATSLRSNRVR